MYVFTGWKGHGWTGAATTGRHGRAAAAAAAHERVPARLDLVLPREEVGVGPPLLEGVEQLPAREAAGVPTLVLSCHDAVHGRGQVGAGRVGGAAGAAGAVEHRGDEREEKEDAGC